jgi:hypothetical protein
LDHTIHHVRNPKSAFSAPGLGDPYPANITGMVAAREQGLGEPGTNVVPVLTHLGHRPSIRARGPVVRFNLVESLVEVLDHPL